MEIIKIPVIRIGGSRGIRIPKKVLEECNISDTVDATVEEGKITIQASKKPREGWADAAAKAHQKGDDHLLIDDMLDLNLNEWAW